MRGSRIGAAHFALRAARHASIIWSPIHILDQTTDGSPEEIAIEAPATTSLQLPRGYLLVRELKRSANGETVALAERAGVRVLLRLEPEASGQRAAELAVLAAVDHPGLARLIDHGSLPNGRGLFIARSWVEGTDLAHWAAGRAPQEIGAVIFRVSMALEHLHARGFVHADLKPENVIVADDGEPTITDFGLARQRGRAAGAVSGTPYFVAPEVLTGAAPGPRADLFAVGVMLHGLLVRRRAPAREFYARFPREDFFAASATVPDELPEWARDVVAELLAVDPERRPASAAAVGRRLAARLGVARTTSDAWRETLTWPHRWGREAWYEAIARELGEAAAPTRLHWIRTQEREDVRTVLEELAVVASLAGARVRRVRLGERELASDADVDTWARELLRAELGATTLLTIEPSGAGMTPSQQRALLFLARSWARGARSTANPSGTLAVGAVHAPPASELTWREHALPPLDEARVLSFLEARMPDEESSRRAECAQLLLAASEGAGTALDTALRTAQREGFIVEAANGWRLRRGPVPARITADASAKGVRLPDTARARRLVCALEVCGGAAPLSELADLAELSPLDAARAGEELASSGLCAVAARDAGPWVEADPAALGAALSEPSLAPILRATFERRAQALEHAKASRARVLAAAYFGGRVAARELEQEAEELRDHGQAELALELLDGVRRESQRLGRERDPRLDAQLALCWTDLGDGARALALVDELDVGSDGALAARVERVRGRVAAQRHATADALEHFDRAAALDPDDGGEALLARVQLLHEARRDADLRALVDSAHDALARVQPRVASQIVSHQAMSLLRLGEIDRARAMLEAQLADPAFAGDPDRDAGLRINLGTLERRAGDLPRAIAHFELAAAHCERAGVLTRVAQSRALFGGALRDAGELLRAEPLLASAVEIRERLGDQVGASAARGMYGMLLLERGRARSAIAELALAAKELRTAGRRTDASLLDAMRDEMLARVGQPSDTASTRGEAARHGEGDPRALLAFARAHALRGDSDTARELAQRAASLSKGLGLGLIHEEASFLERTLEPPRRESFESFAGGASRAAQDARLFTLLATPSLDEAALRALARELGERGRDDRSARAWIALAARAGHAIHREEAAREARRMLDACSAGLTAGEARALSDALLSVPDPWPADLRAAFASASTEAEFEMEVLSLLEINHRLLSQQDLTGLLGVIVEQALAVSGAERGFLVLEENGELAFDTALDSRRGGIDAPDVEVSHSVLRDALDRMQPVRISNAVDDPMLGAAPSVIALELRSILCVPFQVQPGLRGVIYADHRLREGAFDDRAERMLRLLADQAALAVLQVRRIEEIRRLNRRIHQQKANVESDLRTARTALQQAGIAEPAGGLVGNSPPMRAVHSLIQRAAQTRLAVLVCGPSGTGKELAARALHDLGPRASGPFVSENCAAFPATLIEAELFGAQRGAFTGADRDREGLFERAHGGTLFLDEVGELPLELQAKLLRVLETSQVRRLGDSELRTVDFRLVAATNRDLAREVGEGRFRADLFYRLDGLRIEMPPLSTRTEDIPALVDHCLRVQAAPGEEPRRVSSAVLARLSRRAWPGNVRELFNEVARLCAITSGEVDDPELVRDAQLMPGPASSAGGATGTLAEIERNAILRALEVAGGDKRVAAKALGISRAKIYQRLKEWGEESAGESVGEG